MVYTRRPISGRSGSFGVLFSSCFVSRGSKTRDTRAAPSPAWLKGRISTLIMHRICIVASLSPPDERRRDVL